MEKKANYTDCFSLTSDLILEKKKKNLNLRKELTEMKSFHYLEFNKLYESTNKEFFVNLSNLARKTASKTLRDNIQKNKINLPDPKKTKTNFSVNSFGDSNQFSVKTSQYERKYLSSFNKNRAKTSSKEHRKLADFFKTKENENFPNLSKDQNDKYSVLFEKQEENVWDILEGMSASSTWENWGKKGGFSSVLIPLIEKN